MNFPTLKLMKDDFITYYLNQDDDGGQPGNGKFRKLVFEFQINQSGRDYEAYLIAYALQGKREIMNTSPIRLVKYNDAPCTIDIPVNLANLELKRNDLRTLIGKPNQLIQFNFLRFQATKENNGYISYTVYVDDQVSLTVLKANPSPPAGQD